MKNILFIIILFFAYNNNIFAQNLDAKEDSALVTVFVHEQNMPNSPGETILFCSKKNKVKYEITTKADGFAHILLPEGEIFDISYKDFFVETDYAILEIPSEEGLIYYEVEVIYEPAQIFRLENVYFDFGKATLRTDSYKSLNELVDMLKTKSNINIEIGGHTDNVGDDQNNLILSQNRAESVRKYLISKGITATRIEAKGYGELKPIANNDSEEGRQMNRRTEVKILSR